MIVDSASLNVRFSKNLRSIRYDIIGKDISEISKSTGLSRSEYSKLENGETTPDLSIAEKITSSLGVSLDLALSEAPPELKDVSIDQMLIELRRYLVQCEGSERYLREFLNVIEAQVNLARLDAQKNSFTIIASTRLFRN